MILALAQRHFGIVPAIDQLRRGRRAGFLLWQGDADGPAHQRARGIGRVAYDLEQPSARIGAAEAAEIRGGAQHRFLHHILGIGRVAREITRQIVGGVEMRQHRRFELNAAHRLPMRSPS
jgi:hypothetical protein